MAGSHRHIAAILTAAALAAGTPAMAQDAAKATPDALALQLSPGTTDILNLSSALDGAFDEEFRRSLFEADNAVRLGPSTGADPAFGFDRAIDAGGLIGLDVELQPRASLAFGDTEDSALVGAIVRIGEDLKAGEVKPNTWYLFAGADAEAMHYTPGGLTTGEFAYGDRVIVGDAQAGIGYRIGDADLSLGYYHREISSLEDNDPSNDFSISEDAAAISFTWRR